MSLADAALASTPVRAEPVAAQRGAVLRLYRSELRLVFGRRRNQVLLAALGVVPLLIGVAIQLSKPAAAGDGPQFLSDVTSNGLFLVFTALTVSLPIFLPLAVGIVSGDAVAGEASAGTLRYLLTVPVSRVRLLAVKAAGGLTFAVGAVVAVAVVGLVTGLVLFPVGRVTLLSGDTVSYAEGLARAAAVAGYVVLSLTGLVAVGLFVSTLTEVPVAAMASTVAFAVVSQVLGALPQLSAIHPVLVGQHWLDFGELLRTDVDWGSLAGGLGVQAGYVAVFGALAWARFTTADITA